MSPPKKASYQERMAKKQTRAIARDLEEINEMIGFLKKNMDAADIMKDVGICRGMVFQLPDCDAKEEIKTRFFRVQRMVQSRVLWHTQTLSGLAPILD